MDEKTKEQLSALMDGELESAQQDKILRQLAQDKDLQQRWQGYHLIGDALREDKSITTKPSRQKLKALFFTFTIITLLGLASLSHTKAKSYIQAEQINNQPHSLS